MPDVFSSEKRSQIMSRVKSHGNRATELALICVFRENKIRGWRRHTGIFGKPDFVFPSARVIVFVDGCFWHGCPLHGRIPATNADFWKRKIERNKARDQLVRRELIERGWIVLGIWQHELREPSMVARRVARTLRKAMKYSAAANLPIHQAAGKTRRRS
jgi:DNA mismatch endonuclease (patch repair protein)